ncbi:MAG TPA: hypothetical protein VF940_21335 [Streptosporangiaceae bacterium]
MRVELAHRGSGDGMTSVRLKDLDLDLGKGLDAVGEIGSAVAGRLNAATPVVAGSPVILPGLGRPILALDADYPDIAILRVQGLPDHPCVLLDAGRPEPADGFQVFGYPSEAAPKCSKAHGRHPALFS